jgi:ribose transport system substrate-binding protein
MKKFLVMLSALMLLGSVVFAQGQTDNQGAKTGPIRIGVTTASADHGWTGGMVWWANKTINEYQEKYGDQFQFTYVTADSSANQIQAVDNLLSKGIDYLVIQPTESAPLTSTVKEAHDAGVKCIVVDRGLSATNFGYINLAGDNTQMGELSGEWLAKEMLEKTNGGNLVCIGGLPCTIDTERMDGFFSVIDKEPSIVNLLGKDKYEFGNFSTQKGLEVMENYLTQYPHIDAVFCQDDDILIGVLQAYKESGRTDITTFLGGAASKATLKMIIDGDPLVRGNVTYSPKMIKNAIDYCIDVALGKRSADFHTKDTCTYEVIPSVTITKENAKDFYEPDSVF